MYDQIARYAKAICRWDAFMICKWILGNRSTLMPGSTEEADQ